MGRGKKVPELPKHLNQFWLAFMALHGQRQYNESGPQPIQFQEILGYLTLEGSWVPRQLVSKFTRMLRAVDAAYIDLVQKRRERQMSKS